MAEISWSGASGGAFDAATDWKGGVRPGAADDAVLGPSSRAYTVTSSAKEQVNSIQLAESATFSITAGNFTATMGTGSGANAGEISIAPGASLTAGGDIDNSGLIQLNQATPDGGDIVDSWPVALDDATQGSNLVVASNGLTLSGGGKVHFENPIHFVDPALPAPPGLALDTITGVTGAVLTNVDNTIYGAGTIGLGPLAFVNERQGVVDASLSTPFQLRAVGGGITNEGLLEDTGAAGLYIGLSTVDQTGGGAIEANGGIVYFSYADIVGGALSSSGNWESEADRPVVESSSSVSSPASTRERPSPPPRTVTAKPSSPPAKARRLGRRTRRDSEPHLQELRGSNTRLARNANASALPRRDWNGDNRRSTWLRVRQRS